MPNNRVTVLSSSPPLLHLYLLLIHLSKLEEDEIKSICIILHGKLKEALAMGTNPMYTMVAPVILVVSYGTTRLLSNSPAHATGQAQFFNYDASQWYHGFWCRLYHLRVNDVLGLHLGRIYLQMVQSCAMLECKWSPCREGCWERTAR